MPKEAWAILNIHYEYNDEYHYPVDGEAGHTGKVYLNKAKAEAALKEKELASWKILFVSNPNSYNSHIEDYAENDLDSLSDLDEEEFTKRLRIAGIYFNRSKHGHEINLILPEKIHDDLLWVVIEACNKLRFHKLEQVIVED